MIRSKFITNVGIVQKLHDILYFILSIVNKQSALYHEKVIWKIYFSSKVNSYPNETKYFPFACNWNLFILVLYIYLLVSVYSIKLFPFYFQLSTEHILSLESDLFSQSAFIFFSKLSSSSSLSLRKLLACVRSERTYLFSPLSISE